MNQMKKHAFRLLACSAALLAPIFTIAQSSPDLSDPQIAHVAVTANQIDINTGELAISKSNDADVKKFAQTMIDDHKAVIGQAAALASKLGVTPQDNDFSKKLNADADKAKKELGSKTAREFDKAYINHEVAYHKAVIQAVRDVLIPQTDNQELKALLQNVLPALEAHLHHAEMIQKNYR
jgi:putative membrane protein